MRNFLATLLLSHGVPMLSHGDEVARSQAGNNNAYCQDGPLTWMAWDPSPAVTAHRDFTRRLIALRLAEPVFRRRTFTTARDLAWIRPDGKEMTAEDWHDPATRALGLLLRGDRIAEVDEDGAPAHRRHLPRPRERARHRDALRPARAPGGGALDARPRHPGLGAADPASRARGRRAYALAERSLAVLRLEAEGEWP